MFKDLVNRCMALTCERDGLRLIIKDAYENQRLITAEEVAESEPSTEELMNIFKILDQDLCKVGFSDRVINCFKEAELFTVGDLLDEIEENKMKNLKALKDFGDSAEEILRVLREKNLLDAQNHSII